MKIGIIGGGASGTYLAIRLKELRPDFDVSIIERNDKLLKKIAVTGNGRCNYANIGETKGKYNNDDFANKILKNLTSEELIANFERYGIHPTKIDNLVYPISLSAQTMILMLLKRVEELGIKVYLNENVLDYSENNKGYVLKTNVTTRDFDILVFTSGGKAYPQLGTNGDVIEMLKTHGYQIEELYPSLCPIKTKENTKKISGQRSKAKVSLYDKNKIYYCENGEVLFKDDGLSGIVILNISNRINSIKDKNNIKIVLDLAPNYNNIKEDNYIEYVSPKIASYLVEHHLDIHAVAFTFKSLYDFNVAEVSHGGVSINNLNENLGSKTENNIYFAGEIIDVDGMCGGYNLMFAFACSETIARHLKGK